MQRWREVYAVYARGRSSAVRVAARFRLDRGDVAHEFDNAEAFFDELVAGVDSAELEERHGDELLRILKTNAETTITVRATTLDAAAGIVALASQEDIRRPVRPLRVFLGHGRDHQWRAVRDLLQQIDSFEVLTYEEESEPSELAQQVLQRMSAMADVALIVHTAELVLADGTAQASANVVHETGLFQGVLGLNRTLILRERSCAGFANVGGVTELGFSDGNIREVLGDAVATLLKVHSALARGTGSARQS